VNGAFREKLKNLQWPPRRFRWNFLLGSRGERLAARFLKRQGFHLIVRNYKCVAGEVDLICSREDLIAFIEVKSRTSADAQDPQEAARTVQWRRIERAARYFLLQYPVKNRTYRFDLVTVIYPGKGSPVLEHFEGAYQPLRS